MRKVRMQMQMTLDGFVARKNGGLDWINWEENQDRIKYVNELTDATGTILMGRKMADGFVKYWQSVEPDSPAYTFAKKMIDIPKVVFTKTLEKSDWINTTLAKGPLAEEIKKLKQQDGKDIIVYGGAGFMTSLIKENLIDEYHIAVNPTAIGSGMTIFSEAGDNFKLKLVKAVPFSDGIVVHHYESK